MKKKSFQHIWKSARRKKTIHCQIENGKMYAENAKAAYLYNLPQTKCRSTYFFLVILYNFCCCLNGLALPWENGIFPIKFAFEKNGTNTPHPRRKMMEIVKKKKIK